jgi:hypothetical protein
VSHTRRPVRTLQGPLSVDQQLALLARLHCDPTLWGSRPLPDELWEDITHTQAVNVTRYLAHLVPPQRIPDLLNVGYTAGGGWRGVNINELVASTNWGEAVRRDEAIQRAIAATADDAALRRLICTWPLARQLRHELLSAHPHLQPVLARARPGQRHRAPSHS